jgi:uncharacterized repeat protein (TIGR03803 family)
LLWGTTQQGGTANAGTLFKFDPATRVFTSVVEFSGANGAQPEASLISDGAGFFGELRGSEEVNELGTLFKIEMATGVLTTAVEFTGTTGCGEG